MSSEPEQWAVELARVVRAAPSIKMASWAVQRAFEERERKLRAEMAVVQQSHKWVYAEMQRLENALKDIASRAHANLAQACLKARENGDG